MTENEASTEVLSTISGTTLEKAKKVIVVSKPATVGSNVHAGVVRGSGGAAGQGPRVATEDPGGREEHGLSWRSIFSQRQSFPPTVPQSQKVSGGQGSAALPQLLQVQTQALTPAGRPESSVSAACAAERFLCPPGHPQQVWL